MYTYVKAIFSLTHPKEKVVRWSLANVTLQLQYEYAKFRTRLSVCQKCHLWHFSLTPTERGVARLPKSFVLKFIIDIGCIHSQE